VIEDLEKCDDGNQRDGDGCSSRCLTELKVNVHWRLATLASVDQPCPAGFDTAVVLAVFAMGTPIPRTFACAAGQGEVVLERIPVWDKSWDLSVRITNGANGAVFGESQVDEVLLNQPSAQSSHTIFTDAGTLTLSWFLREGMTSRTCEALGITDIQVEARPATGSPIVQTLPCAQNRGVTELMPTGTYQVVVSAGTARVTLDQVSVGVGGKTTIIGPLDLAL